MKSGSGRNNPSKIATKFLSKTEFYQAKSTKFNAEILAFVHLDRSIALHRMGVCGAILK
jgi:hypothetical protein